MRVPKIDQFYIPAPDFEQANTTFGPGELRPAWVRVEYSEDKGKYKVEGKDFEVQPRPKFLRLQLEDSENNYRHMFELTDKQTHYFIPTEPVFEEYQAFYDELAQYWGEFEIDHEHSQFGQWIIEVLERENVAKDAKILNYTKDFGGSVAKPLIDAGYSNVDILTLSPKMVDKAKQSGWFNDSNNITCGNILEYLLQDNYDVIVAAQTLQYFVKDARAIFKKCDQLLKPDGIVVSSDIYYLPFAKEYFKHVEYSNNQMTIKGEPIRRMTLNVLKDSK